MSIGWQMDRRDVVYINIMEYYCDKKNEILPLATMWMEVECIMLSEISQRKTNIWFHSWNLGNKTDENRGREGKIR